MTPNPASISSLAALLATPCDCPPNYAERGRHAPDCRYGFIHEFLDDQDIAALLDRERSRETPPDLEGLRALSDAASLDMAWNEVEAALPDGWDISLMSLRKHVRPETDGPQLYAATAASPFDNETRTMSVISSEDGRERGSKHDATPAAALLALAARLRAALRVPDIGERE